MQKEPMTSEVFDKITALLNELKTVIRPKILIAIEEARQLGDLKENAEYHAAREEQGNTDKKIAELEDTITKAIIINPENLAHDKVSFGSTVKLLDLSDDHEIIYKIVSSFDSNPDIGHISFHSPLAKQLLGKSEGDEVHAVLPGGKREFEVVEIKYVK
ncbi:MAG: transcription elongation factor GreA [Arcobacteraceae bacterium]|jgi:transcription elongation factor GreA|nr:transcription elongation factor GreA [Arcobacteraceae bacterium]